MLHAIKIIDFSNKDLLAHYSIFKQKYKSLLLDKKAKFNEKIEKKLVMEAELVPYTYYIRYNLVKESNLLATLRININGY
jgi:hypothetical protein